MRTEAIRDAMMDAKKFLRLAHAIMDAIAEQDENHQDFDTYAPAKARGKLRRASMDLTRSLADMRLSGTNRRNA